MKFKGDELEEKLHEKSGHESIPFNCAIAQCVFLFGLLRSRVCL